MKSGVDDGSKPAAEDCSVNVDLGDELDARFGGTAEHIECAVVVVPPDDCWSVLKNAVVVAAPFDTVAAAVEVPSVDSLDYSRIASLHYLVIGPLHHL